MGVVSASRDYVTLSDSKYFAGMGLFEFSWSGTRCGCSDAGIVCRRGRPQLDEEEVLISVNREQEHRKRKKRFILCKDFFPFVPARGVLAVMTFLGTFVLYALRINLSVAIVAMTNATSDKSKEVTNASCNPTAPVFQWDNTQQGKSVNHSAAYVGISS